ncbi:glycosyltransferase family 4 protein [Paenibacillus xylanexedens]|uniref:glycosyltransferase family 4 protein n=1 Tax=Paenibacillus xylanexedens TaxID=528191 RepID=UPI003CFEF909
MNIYVLSREYPPNTVGGTSTVARSLAEGLSRLKDDYNVVVISSHKETEDYLETINKVKILRVGNKQIYSETTNLDSDNLVSHRRFLKKIKEMIDQFGKPDIIFLPDLFCFPEAYIIAKQFNVPLINILLQDFRAIVPYDRGDKHKVSNSVNADRDTILELEGKSIRLSTHTVFISQSLSDRILSYYPGNFSTSVIHLGITPEELLHKDDIDYQTYRQKLAKGNEKILMGCGRLVPVKGFDYLIRAFKEIVKQHDHLKLAIIGIGPEEEYLKIMANELGVEEKLIFLGDISREEAIIYFHVADIAIVPSLWESFCYVCAEFMGVGKPIVASAVDSLNELIPTDGFGSKIGVATIDGRRVLDEQGIVDSVIKYLDDPCFAEEHGVNARNRVLSLFTNDKFIEGIVKLMSQISS